MLTASSRFWPRKRMRAIANAHSEAASVETITEPKEILPGFFVVSTQSDRPGTRDMNEASLVVRTPDGLVVVVGCSHPGIEKILAAAARIDPRIHLVAGGFHLVGTPPAEIERVAAALDQTLHVARVAPGHCTSERGFAAFLRQFGDRFERAGVGRVLELR